ncbi:MAG: lipopolysaccharide transport periplasmic protein LptA [Rhodocyclaceae bacterium]
MKIRTIALTLALLTLPALAEPADRDQPVNIEADRVIVDDRNKTHTFEGSVVLTQGTLEIRGDKMVVVQGPDGFQTGVATGTPERPATFRQRREGTNDYVEGQAERIEYDTRAERARLFQSARVSSGGDQVTGDFIEYDALTERYYASNTPGPASDGRVRAVIQPRASDAPQ